jgi:hypothetical protein
MEGGRKGLLNWVAINLLKDNSSNTGCNYKTININIAQYYHAHQCILERGLEKIVKKLSYKILREGETIKIDWKSNKRVLAYLERAGNPEPGKNMTPHRSI